MKNKFNLVNKFLLMSYITWNDDNRWYSLIQIDQKKNNKISLDQLLSISPTYRYVYMYSRILNLKCIFKKRKIINKVLLTFYLNLHKEQAQYIVK